MDSRVFLKKEKQPTCSWQNMLPTSISTLLMAYQFSSIIQSCPTLCDPMDCGTPGFPVHHSLRAYSNSCPLPRWWHPMISSSVIPFSSCLQSFPVSGSFLMSQLFSPGGQSTGASVSAAVLPSEYWGLTSFRIDWFDLLAVQGTLKSLLQHNSKASILQPSAFFMV